jgi:alpha-glucosidase
LPDTPIPAEAVVDIAGRDPERTPIPWLAPSIAGAGAGFTTGRPWLPIGPTAETLNVASEADDEGSTLRFYQRLIGVRRTHPSLSSGEQLMLTTDNDDVMMFRRTSGDDATLVVLNFSDADVSVALPEGASLPATIAISTDWQRSDRGPFRERLSLRPLEGVVVTF